MPSDHRKVAILNAMRARLAQPTVAGGYHYNSQGCYAWALPQADVVATPCYLLADVRERITRKTPTLTHREMTVVIHGIAAVHVGEDPNPSTVLARLLADIEVALDGPAGVAAMEALAGYVDHVLVSTATVGLADVGYPAATIEAVYTVQYRTRAGDPKEAAP